MACEGNVNFTGVNQMNEEKTYSDWYEGNQCQDCKEVIRPSNVCPKCGSRDIALVVTRSIWVDRGIFNIGLTKIGDEIKGEPRSK